MGRRSKAPISKPPVLESARLEELIEACRTRALGPEELDELTLEAVASGRHQAILLRVISFRNETGSSAASGLSSRLADLLRRPRPSRPAYRKSHLYVRDSFPFHMTDHAVERFYARWPSFGGDPEALAAEISAAAPTKKRSLMGDQIWVGPTGALFVVKYDLVDDRDRRSHDGRPVCVTVLPEGAGE